MLGRFLIVNKGSELRDLIIEKALEQGADLAGIARVEDLKLSQSYEKYEQDPYYGFFDGLPPWPENARSILVIALQHPVKTPELDWWDPKPGGTPGNRYLISIQKKLKKWVVEEMGLGVQILPYKLEEGGILLKDSAVLAGIGIIGKNNLILTPEFGARVRLRGMFLDIDIEPAKQLEFAPCDDCNKPCFLACPQKAFRSGVYERKYCQVQMRLDEDNVKPLPDEPETDHVRYCRACELSCPVALNGKENSA
jgi:epoxyqueuosine reductase